MLRPSGSLLQGKEGSGTTRLKPSCVLLQSDEDLAAELAATRLPAADLQGAGALPQQRPHIYNTAGLLERLEDIAWVADAPWDETQTITGTDPEQVEDVDDDLTRELSFYNQVHSCAGS